MACAPCAARRKAVESRRAASAYDHRLPTGHTFRHDLPKGAEQVSDTVRRYKTLGAAQTARAREGGRGSIHPVK